MAVQWSGQKPNLADASSSTHTWSATSLALFQGTAYSFHPRCQPALKRQLPTKIPSLKLPPPPPGLSLSFPPGLTSSWPMYLPAAALSREDELCTALGLELSKTGFAPNPNEPMYIKTTPATSAPPSPCTSFTDDFVYGPPSPASSASSPLSSFLPLSPLESSPDVQISDNSSEVLQVHGSDVEGVPCMQVLWRIRQAKKKFSAMAGKAWISPSFDLFGLSDLRLLMFPDAKGETENSLKKKRQAKLKTAINNNCSLDCGLKLKIHNGNTPVMHLYITVGSIRKGPLLCDFAEHAMHGYDNLGIDWLTQVKDNGDLMVSLEIVEVSGGGSTHFP